MNAAQLLTSFETALKPFVQAERGHISIAADPDHVCELLANSPAGWRLILSYAGDDSVDPDLSPGIEKVQFNATVQAASGLAIQPGSETYKTNPTGRDPLLALASTVSRWMRGLSGDHQDIQDKGVRKVTQQWLVIEGLATRQLNLTFQLRIAADNPIPVPVAF